MASFLANRAPRTMSFLFGELILAGTWAMIDQQFIRDHAVWFITLGLLGLIGVWFWDQILEFWRWKAGGTNGLQQDWVPFHLALRYIALRSSWSYEISEKEWQELDNLLQREVSERLAREEIHARGRAVISATPFKLTATTESIPPDFWSTAFFQAFAEIVMREDDRCAAARDGSFFHAPARAYRGIVLDMVEVRRVWPEAPGAIRRKKKSTFHKAIDQYSKEYLEADGGFIAEFVMWAATK